MVASLLLDPEMHCTASDFRSYTLSTKGLQFYSYKSRNSSLPSFLPPSLPPLLPSLSAMPFIASAARCLRQIGCPQAGQRG